MTDQGAVGGYVATGLGLCLNFSDFSPSWLILQIIIFTISTGISVFNTYTDWQVVLAYKEVGFDNPLLPPSIHWLRAWLLFASIGTFLTIISVLHDGVGVLYDMHLTCKKRNRRNVKETYHISNAVPLDSSFGNSDPKDPVESRDKSLNKKEKKEDGESSDFFKCCYRCGCNESTRNETLGALALWFQDVPMLTLSILYALAQTSCDTPERRDVTPILLDIGISASAATVASMWRLFRSFVRLYSSVCVRIKMKNKCAKKCLPKKSDSVYPPDSCMQYCIFPFYFGLIFQVSAIAMAVGATAGIWISYGVIKTGDYNDTSLGIYRYSTKSTDVRLFDIAGTIIPPNGSFVNLEKIPSQELLLDRDIFCLSEFEYRSEEYQIYFTVAQIVVVSLDGKFCVPITGPNVFLNDCNLFYTFEDFVLYYASIDRSTGISQRFSDRCTIVRDMFIFNFRNGPRSDFNINVTKRIDRAGFPEGNEPLIIYYPPPTDAYLNVSSILYAETRNVSITHTFQDLQTSANVTCVLHFKQDRINNRISFNYRDINQTLGCTCSSSPGPNCRQFHHNLKYAYLTYDGYIVPYTHCSGIPQEYLVPYHNQNLLVKCPCS